MEAKTVLEAFDETCPGHKFEAGAMPVDEIVIDIPAACLKEVVGVLQDVFSIYHLSTITGQAIGTDLELLYHFWHERGITLRVLLPRDEARVCTLTDIVPGADFYEREVGEMLGVTFEGHPGPEHLLLPDDWDEGPPMLEVPAPEEEEEA